MPRFIKNNIADEGIAYPILFGEHFIGVFSSNVLQSDCFCNIHRYFGLPAFCASKWSFSPTIIRCFNVFRLGANCKMAGVHTRRIIAIVKNKFPIWNSSITELIGDSVRGTSSFIAYYNSVTATIFRRLPNPTSISFIYSSPKTYLECVFEFFPSFSMILKSIHHQIIPFVLSTCNA